jgi:thymidylate synthase (FAD)
MKLTLLDYTGSGYIDEYYAANLLIFTKQTRVKRGPEGLVEIASWPEQRKRDELAYMANTIRSSWEFCDYTFLAEGVTRSLTHQLVRTRHGSYAQQTLQILNASGFEYHTGPSIKQNTPSVQKAYDDAMASIDSTYKFLLSQGVSTEDARELLPHGILTNITFKMNLRTLVDLIKSREGPRNLQMFRDLVGMIKEKMLKVHPWLDIFMSRELDNLLKELDEEIRSLPMDGDVAGPKFSLLKKLDQVRRLT